MSNGLVSSVEFGSREAHFQGNANHWHRPVLTKTTDTIGIRTQLSILAWPTVHTSGALTGRWNAAQYMITHGRPRSSFRGTAPTAGVPETLCLSVGRPKEGSNNIYSTTKQQCMKKGARKKGTLSRSLVVCAQKQKREARPYEGRMPSTRIERVTF